jgi:hypothetical protein
VKRALVLLLVPLALLARAEDLSGALEGLEAGTRIVYASGGKRWAEEISGVTSTTISSRLVELDASGAPIASTASFARDVPLELARLARVHDPSALDLGLWARHEGKAKKFTVEGYFARKPVRTETVTISGKPYECAVYQKSELSCVQRNGATLTVMQLVEHWVSPRYPFTLKVVEDKNVTFSVEERH